MRDLAATKSDLLLLADEPALASRSDDLRSLSNALGSDDAFLWAKLDLFDVFGPDAIEMPTERRDGRLVWWLEFARNLCILLPLLITWLGIARAADAYGALLAANPAAAEVPFIQLWQEGFDGRTWAFSTIGMLDFVAILAVIVLTGCATYFRGRLEVRVSDTERTMWTQLRRVLTDASLHLAQNAFDLPARFNEELTAAASSMKDTTKQVRYAARQVNDVLDSLVATSGRIEVSLSDFTAQNIRQVDGVAAFVDSANLIGQWQSSLVQSTNALAARADALIAQQQVTQDQIASGLREQSASSRALSEYAGMLASSAIGQTDAANRFLDNLDTERQAQEAIAAHWTAATDSMDRSAQQLAALAAQLQVASAGLDATMTQLPETMASSYGGVEHAIEQLAERFDAVATQLTAASQSLGVAATSLPSATHDAQVQMQGHLVQWQNSLASASAGMGVTADRLAETADRFPASIAGSLDQLRAAIGSFDHAIASLNGLSRDLQHAAASARSTP